MPSLYSIGCSVVPYAFNLFVLSFIQLNTPLLGEFNFRSSYHTYKLTIAKTEAF